MNTNQVWETYHQDIKQFLLSRIKNDEAVNDVLQDTFIKIHTKLESLQNHEKLKSWVFTIARNTMLDYFRTSKNDTEFQEYNVQTEENPKVHDEKDCLYGIIKQLPKKYRDPLFLADIKGKKQAEVANQLKLPIPTAKSRIQRARKLIAQGYMECCDFKMNQQGHLVGEIKDKEDCKICS
ncbi:sigma-70 family RNA polymerase sigma factor [Pontimicrobium sp. SW4]|uniref:Sigma-70 family RNA polymerase sigma factor n=1 Tax=Pontimicrobium sp. SW4 TaxID=3153519 RepID=A0AAU7BQQ5_9FLAO